MEGVIANQRRNAGVAIRIPCLPLGEGARRSGRMRENTVRRKPSSVSRLRETREPPSPEGKALDTVFVGSQ